MPCTSLEAGLQEGKDLSLGPALLANRRVTLDKSFNLTGPPLPYLLNGPDILCLVKAVSTQVLQESEVGGDQSTLRLLVPGVQRYLQPSANLYVYLLTWGLASFPSPWASGNVSRCPSLSSLLTSLTYNSYGAPGIWGFFFLS